jgi:hypothetical protein
MTDERQGKANQNKCHVNGSEQDESLEANERPAVRQDFLFPIDVDGSHPD